MRLQPIENLSKTYSGDPHLDQAKLNGLLLLTIYGVLELCPNMQLKTSPLCQTGTLENFYLICFAIAKMS